LCSRNREQPHTRSSARPQRCSRAAGRHSTAAPPAQAGAAAAAPQRLRMPEGNTWDTAVGSECATDEHTVRSVAQVVAPMTVGAVVQEEAPKRRQERWELWRKKRRQGRWETLSEWARVRTDSACRREI
jgi:hypothetical protein